jgi:proteasome lid subunit RPN8/RPN11
MPQTIAGQSLYRYCLEFFAVRGGARIHELPLRQTDFGRAIEATFFEALRNGLVSEYRFSPETARIEPGFTTSSLDLPRADAFTVVLPLPGGAEQRLEFDADFFARRALHLGADLVRAGRLPMGTTLLYRLSAMLEEDDPRPRRRLFALEPTTIEVPIRSGSLKSFARRTPWDNPRCDEIRVLIPRRVIADALDEARRDPAREVGGTLLGHLRRDDESCELFLEVTCLVPAEGTTATELSVTFTPTTWARVREVIAVRGEGEIFAGWVHSHPFLLCQDCPLTPPPECVAKVLFYSSDDEFLMELSFAQPFMVGLLTALDPRLESAVGHAPVRLFGWRDGTVAARGFEVFDDSD